MKSYSFYSIATGLFTGVIRNTNRQMESLQVPPDCAIREGTYDHLSQQVDLSNDRVVDYQPPAPDSDHKWIHDDPLTGDRVRRWVLTEEAAERREKKSTASARMAVLASKHERASREFLLGIVPTTEDRAAGAMTLQEIEDEMAALRLDVR